MNPITSPECSQSTSQAPVSNQVLNINLSYHQYQIPIGACLRKKSCNTSVHKWANPTHLTRLCPRVASITLLDQMASMLCVQHCQGNVSVVGFINGHLLGQHIDSSDASLSLENNTLPWHRLWLCHQYPSTPMMQVTFSMYMINVQAAPAHR